MPGAGPSAGECGGPALRGVSVPESAGRPGALRGHRIAAHDVPERYAELSHARALLLLDLAGVPDAPTVQLGADGQREARAGGDPGMVTCPHPTPPRPTAPGRADIRAIHRVKPTPGTADS